jgi:hypothetical protein
MAILPIRTGNGDIVSIDTDNQAALVPVLGECCGETCQTVTGSGVITVSEEQYSYGYYSSTYSFWRSPGVAFIMPDGGYFAVDVTYFAGTGNGPYSFSYEDVAVNYFFIDADGNEYNGGETFDGASVPDGGTWEIRLSWCEDCTVVAEIYFNGALFTSATITNVCDVAGPTQCNFEPGCRPNSELSGGPILTGVPLTLTVTDLGGGAFNVLLTDDAPTGVIADPTVGFPGTFSGAMFGCFSQCLPDGYPIMWYLDILEGATPYTLPLIDFFNFTGPAGATGTEIEFHFDVTDWDFDCSTDFKQAVADAVAFFATWVGTYGNATPVVITNATSDALLCMERYDSIIPLASLDPAAAGFIVWQVFGYYQDTDFIQISDFSMECGSLTPSGTQIELESGGGGSG